MIGQTISHYKILEKLGEGGMGVVYKAQDTKLDRTVALKFLPEHVHTSPEEKARFLQEAKAAATLNHPNVCTVYDIKEEGGKNFIVMEFVDGKTLRERFANSPVPIKEAVTFAIQIGEALDEAHSKGIIHRDIKSDNIMVNGKNQIKVMDFGLAKLKGSLRITKASSTVGTLGYMAPEQLQGGEIDARSDIFSFGVVLFELLTGKLPFRGEHEAALMYSILNEEPESIQKYLPNAQPELAHILQTAMEKDRADRYQSVGEMTRELRRLFKQSSRVSRAMVSSSDIPLQPQVHAAPESRPQSKRTLWLSIAGGFVVLASLAIIFLLPKSRNGESTSLAVLNPDLKLRVLSIPFTQISYPGLSRDGNWIAFPGADANNRWDVFYMHVSGTNSRRLTTDSILFGQNLNADISPDGSLIAYSSINQANEGTINMVSSVGGLSKTIATDNPILPRWSPDGQRIGYVRFRTPKKNAAYNFWSMKPDGSDNHVEFSDTLGVSGRFSFNWSPDGKSIVWIRAFKEGHQEIFTHDLATGKEQQLTNDRKNCDDVAWTSKGYIIFSSNRGGNSNLWMVPVTGGTPQQLTKGGGPDIGISLSADNQKLVYLQQQQIGHIWSADLAAVTSRQLTFDDRLISGVALSPDGKKIALVMADIDPLKPDLHLYLQDRDGSNRRQLTSGDQFIQNPTWSPDGKWISLTLFPRFGLPDSAKIAIIDANNPGAPKVISPGIQSFWLDNERLIANNIRTVNGQGTEFNEVVSLVGRSGEPFLGDSTSAIATAAGNMVVYRDDHRKTRGVWIAPIDYAKNPSKYKPRKIATQNGPVIARSANALYYVNPQNELWKMQYASGKQERIKGSFPGLDFSSFGSASRDDKELIYVALQLSGKLVLIENIFK